MITFTALGKKYKFPHSLEEVSLREFIKYCELERDHQPPKYKELISLKEELSQVPEGDKLDRAGLEAKIEAVLEEVSSPAYMEERLSWAAKVVEFWTVLKYTTIMGEDGGEGMNAPQLEALSFQLQKLVNTPPEVEYSNIIEFKGELWYLPAQYMKDSTVIEYLESSQFYKLQEALAGGQWGALASVICILLRKKGEKYNKKLLERREFFLDMPMNKAYKVAFFFTKRIDTYSTLLGTYTAAQAVSKLRRELTC